MEVGGKEERRKINERFMDKVMEDMQRFGVRMLWI